MALYVVIAMAISFAVPFPFSLVAVIGVVLFLSYYIRKRQLGRMGLSGSFSKFGGRGGYNSYYCMNCGTKHKQAACPKCGSKILILLNSLCVPYVTKVNPS